MNRLKAMKSISVLLMIMPFLLALMVVWHMPDIVPTHYNIDGRVDAYSSKYSIFIFPVICIFTSIVMMIVAYIYRNNRAREGKISESEAIYIINISILAMFNVLNGYIIYTSFNEITDLNNMIFPFDNITFIMFGILYVIIGFISMKTDGNGIVNISMHIPGRAECERINRHVGKIFILIGAINIILNIFVNNMLIRVGILLVTSLIATIWILAYTAMNG